jgi:hypothetical protein
MPNPRVQAAAEGLPANRVNRRLALLGGLTAVAAFWARPQQRKTLPPIKCHWGNW